eukprot:Hpha_TRINITY_DN16101_c3_g3::TRINITY_DN16101_c3_g3_i1::g.8942::m.8942
MASDKGSPRLRDSPQTYRAPGAHPMPSDDSGPGLGESTRFADRHLRSGTRESWLSPDEQLTQPSETPSEPSEFPLAHPRVLDLGDVVLNNKHHFARFRLTNKSEESVRVQLESNVPTLGFQQSNENFHMVIGDEIPLIDMDGNLQIGESALDRPPTLVNQVFNYVNLIRDVNLGPGASEEFIVSYRASGTKDAGPQLVTKREGTVSLSTVDARGHKNKRSIQFTARCCLSMMEVTPAELDFGVIGADTCNVLQVVVHNRSPFPLFYIMRLGTASGALAYQLTDYDTQAAVLDRQIRVDEHTHQTIQVRVLPKAEAVGEHERCLYVQNLLDESTHTVTMTACVDQSAMIMKPPIMMVSSGPLEFGDCYAGVPVVKVIEVASQSVHPVVLSFAGEGRDAARGTISCRVQGDAPDKGGAESSDEGADTPASALDLPERVPPTGMLETLLRPGRTERIEVWYTPDFPSQDAQDSEKVRKQPERLRPARWKLFVRAADTVEAAREKARQKTAEGKKTEKEEGELYSKTMLCTAAVCVSRVDVRETELNFGDSVVGESTTCQVQIINPCDLSARISVDFDSRVMTLIPASRDVDIPPRSEASLSFQMTPHIVNPSFRKQVTIRNHRNKRNNIIIRLYSNNVATKDASQGYFHSTYYHVSFPHQGRRRHVDATGGGEEGDTQANPKELLPFRHGINVEHLVTGYPVMRTFKLKNIWEEPLVVSLTASRPEWIQLYQLNPAVQVPDVGDVTEVMHSLESDRHLLSTERLGREEERRHVGHVQQLREALDKVIKAGALAPATTIRIPPSEDLTVHAVIRVKTPDDPSSVAKSRGKREESITVKVENVPDVFLREIPVTLNLIVSQIEIGQKNMNLGQVEVGEKRRSAVSVHNNSAVGLLLEVTKNLGVGSTQVRIEASREECCLVCIRPFARRDLDVTLAPVYPGRFHEKLTFRNVLDPEDSKTMTMKAEVTKPATFEVKPEFFDMGTVLVHTPGQQHQHPREFGKARIRVRITNIGRSRRDFRLVPSSSTFNLPGVECKWDYECEAVKSAAAGTRKIEDEIEKGEHKLKIYIRKRKEEKAKRLSQRLENLRKALASGQALQEDGWESSGVSESDDDSRSRTVKAVAADQDGSFIPHSCLSPLLASGAVLHVTITVQIEKIDPSIPLGTLKGRCELSVCEARDQDARQVVQVTVVATDDRKIAAAAAAAAAASQQQAVVTIPPAAQLGNSPSNVPLSPRRPPSPREGRTDSPQADTERRQGTPRSVDPEGAPASPDAVECDSPHPTRALAQGTDVDHGSPWRRPAATSPLASYPDAAAGIKVAPPRADFLSAHIGAAVERWLDISSPAPCSFVIMPDPAASTRTGRVGGGIDEGAGHEDAQIQFQPVAGQCGPGSSIRIRLRVIPRVPRLQHYRWIVKNLSTPSQDTVPVDITVKATAPDVIQVLGAPPAPSVPLREIDFGIVHLPLPSHTHSGYGASEARPTRKDIRVKNLSDRPMEVNFSTTMPTQCRVLQHGTSATVDAGREITVSFGLWPRLDSARAAEGETRNVAGGVIIEAPVHSARVEIPFKAVVGCTALRVSPSGLLDLGRRARDNRGALQERKGEFRLTNTSKRLHLDYSVLVPEDSAVKLNARHEGRLNPGQVEVVPFHVVPKSFGLLEETVEFRNRSCHREQQAIQAIKRIVTLFEDDSCVDTDIKPSSGGLLLLSMPSVLTVHPPGSPPRPVSSPGVPTTPGVAQSGLSGISVSSTAPGSFSEAMRRHAGIGYTLSSDAETRAQVTLQNKSGAQLTLVPRTDAHGRDNVGSWVPVISVGGRDQPSGPTVLGSPGSHFTSMSPMSPRRAGPAHWTNCGGRVVMGKDSSQTITIVPRCFPDMNTLTPAQKKQLEQNKVVEFSTRVIFVVEHSVYTSRNAAHRHTLAQGRTVLCLTVVLRFCVPKVRFNTSTLDLGRAQDDSAPFSCEIKNVSQVPVRCYVSSSPNVAWGPCMAPSKDVCGFDGRDASGAVLGSPRVSHASIRQHTNVRGRVRSKAQSTPPSAMCPHSLCGMGLVTWANEANPSQPIPMNLQPGAVARLHGKFSMPQERTETEQEPGQTEKVYTGFMEVTDWQTQRLALQATLVRSIWLIDSESRAAVADTPGGAGGWLSLSAPVRTRPGVHSGAGVKHADCKLTVRCLAPLADGESGVRARLSVETTPNLAEYLSMGVLLLATSMHVSDFTFSRDERAVGLRIRCEVRHGVRMPQSLAERLWRSVVEDVTSHYVGGPSAEVHHMHEESREREDPLEETAVITSYTAVTHLREINIPESQPLLLGYLRISAQDHADDSVEIWGSFCQEPTFSLSVPQMLTLQKTNEEGEARHYRTTFDIKNLFETLPVHVAFSAFAKGSEVDSASLKVEPSSVIIPPGGLEDVVVSVVILSAEPEEQLTDSVLVLVQDKDCLCSLRVVGTRFAVEDEPAPDTGSAGDRSPTGGHNPPVPPDVPIPTAPAFPPRPLSTMDLESSGKEHGGEAAPSPPYGPAPIEAEGNSVQQPRSESPPTSVPSGGASAEVAEAVQTDVALSPRLAQQRLESRGEEALPTGDEAAAASSQQPGPEGDSVCFRVHNCKSLEGKKSGVQGRLYALTLPPAAVGSPDVQWKLLLQNLTPHTLEVQVGVVRLHGEADWLAVSKEVVKIPAKEKAPLVLTALTRTIGYYCTYVTLQRRGCVADIVSVRCTMEVVSLGSSKGGQFFDVMVDGRPQAEQSKTRKHTLLVDYGEVFYGEEIVHRSVDIVNQSPQRLDFNLMHTNRRETAEKKVRVSARLSLARSVFRPFSRLAVEANKTVRVYFWYKIVADGDDESVLPARSPPLEIFSDVVLKCRLIKDIEKTIVLRAKALSPQVEVTESLLTFDARKEALSVHKPIMLKNLWDEPARVLLRCDMLTSFSVGEANEPEELTIPPLSSTPLPILPKRAAVESLEKKIGGVGGRGGSGIEEHFTVYNRQLPKEKKQVLLRCAVRGGTSFSHYRDTAEACQILEEMIVAFLRRFNEYVATVEPEVVAAVSAAVSFTTASSRAPDSDDEELQSPTASKMEVSNLSQFSDPGVSVLTPGQTGTSPNSNLAAEEPMPATPRGRRGIQGHREAMLSVYTSALRSEDAKALYFDLRYLTDELVWLTVRGDGAVVYEVARLLFASVLRRPLFNPPPMPSLGVTLPGLDDWRGQARYFDSFSSGPAIARMIGPQ